jgi:uncharacterized protein (DUF2164 family)
MRGKPEVKISADARKQAVVSIRQYFEQELGQEIGDLKASLVLDYFLSEIGPVVYNSAIADAKTFFDERAADLGALCHHDEFPYWPPASKRKPSTS